VNYDHITAVNTAAIKELVQVIEKQQKEIDELKTEIKNLRR
jgi:cell division protein FtsL